MDQRVIRPDRCKGTLLGSVLGEVKCSSLRKRVYVDGPEYGVPLLGGKQMIQLRTSDPSYLARAQARRVAHEQAARGWTIVSSGGTLGRCVFVHRNFEGAIFSQDVMRLCPDESAIRPGCLYAFLSSPYGQVQIAQRGHGSVIPRLRDFQFRSIAIRVPKDKGRAIHEKVVAAHDCRADAREAEDAAFALFLRALRQGRAATEAEWQGGAER